MEPYLFQAKGSLSLRFIPQIKAEKNFYNRKARGAGGGGGGGVKETKRGRTLRKSRGLMGAPFELGDSECLRSDYASSE